MSASKILDAAIDAVAVATTVSPAKEPHEVAWKKLLDNWKDRADRRRRDAKNKKALGRAATASLLAEADSLDVCREELAATLLVISQGGAP